MLSIIEKLSQEHRLTHDEYVRLIEYGAGEGANVLAERARETAVSVFGREIYVRGLVEISSYCKNDCLYCGIRRGNRCAERYRLNEEQILRCCENGHALGFRTFVLQGGDDPWFTEERVCNIVREIKRRYPDCAVTLSLGERPEDIFRAYREAGADRYLLRHETANAEHYAKLHPADMTLASRMECLWTLKKLGFQTGAGFMVGSPGQTIDCLADDMMFLQELKPQMVGIGPFLSHKDTPFRDEPNGSLALTLSTLSIVRLMLPHALLPATTALGTLKEGGREKGILCGANVVMPNLSPEEDRGKYLLYDNKLATGVESAEGLNGLRAQMAKIGYEIVMKRGDYQE